MNQERKLAAILLAGGFGRRLGELGQSLPKGLIPFKETTLVGRLLADIGQIREITQIILVTNNKFFELYQKYLDQNFKNLPIFLKNDGKNFNEERAGALNDLLIALDSPQIKDEKYDCLVLASDTYYEFKMQDFLQFCRQHPDSFALVVRQVKDKNVIKGRFGCAVLQGEKVVDFVEKPENPPSYFAATPFYFYPNSLIGKVSEYHHEGGSMDSPGTIVSWLIRHGVSCLAFVVPDSIIDVGTPEDVAKLKNVI